MNRSVAANLVMLTLLIAPHAVLAQETRPAGRRQRSSEKAVFHLTVPEHDYDLLLARPEPSAITLSALAYRDAEGCVVYGTKPGVYTAQTAVQALKKDMPVAIVLRGLQPDTAYHYQFRWRPVDAGAFTSSAEYTFHTARPAGATFTFSLTADAHLDERTSPQVYLRTLANIRADRPDFHIDLGNLFMTDKHAQRQGAAAQYLAQRYYLGQIGPSVPIFLALGTHDGEAARYDDGSPDALAPWSSALRRRYFPNPVPDEFYTGNAPAKAGEALQNYYAWHWGDALFVVLDPFRYSLRQRAGKDGWAWSLGQAQYQWLAKTLAASPAKYKFIFIHNLLSGDQASRGGVEIAPFNEWGGKNPDGTEGFRDRRPGWDLPVHQLLRRHHVSAVFKAHDNFYGRQELDSIIYLMVPQPSFAGNDRIRDLENYGYKQGTFLGNSGHVRVTVAPQQVVTEYVRSYLPDDQRAGKMNAQVVDRHVITPPAATMGCRVPTGSSCSW